MTVLDPIETFKKPSLPSGEELFQTYSLEINRFLARKVNNRETAEDLAQEVFTVHAKRYQRYMSQGTTYGGGCIVSQSMF